MHEQDDHWVKVELFRWQYNAPPDSYDCRKLDIPQGLRMMALALSGRGLNTGNGEDAPNVMNLALTLRFCARQHSAQAARIRELELHCERAIADLVDKGNGMGKAAEILRDAIRAGNK